MVTLFEPRHRDLILSRVARLTPESKPTWGRMNVGQMVAHCADQLRMTLGELSAAPKPTGALRRFPLKQLVVYVLPWPKGVPTAPELFSTPPAQWEADLQELRTLIDRTAEHGPDGDWPEHPAFGRMSGRAWGVLAYRHLDHHLRQFGV